MEFMFEPYAELYKEYAPQARASIERAVERVDTLSGGNRDVSFQADAPATTGNVIDFKEKFAEAMEGKQVTGETVLKAMVEADPSLADEANGIRSTVDLSEQFKKFGSMTAGEAAEVAQKMYQDMANGQSVKQAVGGLGPSGP
jgi:hypothetical protein